MVERKGSARAIVIPDVKAKMLIPAIEANVVKDATVYTDFVASFSLGIDFYSSIT